MTNIRKAGAHDALRLARPQDGRKATSARRNLATTRAAAAQPMAAELKVQELNHRLKNVLSLVQALVNQSFRAAADSESAHRAINGRIAALARSHDILCQPDPAPADLADIVADTIQVHAGAGAQAFRIHGTSLALRPETTLFFTLALHELATNAVKYGALSSSEGVVRIEWSIENGAEGRMLQFRWSEHYGPVVVEPSRRGFGMQIIERMASTTLGGAAAVAFRPEGVTCEIHAPIDRIAPPR
jgi:two-component sensor histidine kinase